MKIEATDIDVPDVHSVRSKYRALLDDFINMNISKGRIVHDTICDAETTQKGLNRHRRIDEDIAVERRGHIVWLIRL